MQVHGDEWVCGKRGQGVLRKVGPGMSLAQVVTEFYPLLIPGMLALIVLPAITFVEEHRRRRRHVRCLAWDWGLTFRRVGSLEQQAVFSFEAYLLNPRPSPMKLRSASVVLHRDDGRVLRSHLAHSASDGPLGALELQPWQMVYVSVYALFEGEEARELSDFRRASLVGLFAGGETFRWKIAGRGDFVAGRKRLGSERKDFAASLKKGSSERRYYVRTRWGTLSSPRKTPESTISHR
jgi:hypothetical protein